MTPETAINKLLRDSVNLILGISDYAIAAKQTGAPRPTGAYGAVDIASSATIGWEQREYTDDADPDLTENISGGRLVIVELSFFRDFAVDNGRKVHTGLIRQSIQDMFTAAGIGMTRRDPVLELSEPLENGWGERSQFSIFLNILGTDSDIVTAIETYDIAGAYESRGLIYNFNREV